MRNHINRKVVNLSEQSYRSNAWIKPPFMPLHEKVLRQDPRTLPAYQRKSLWIKASAKCINTDGPEPGKAPAVPPTQKVTCPSSTPQNQFPMQLTERLLGLQQLSPSGPLRSSQEPRQ